MREAPPLFIAKHLYAHHWTVGSASLYSHVTKLKKPLSFQVTKRFNQQNFKHMWIIGTLLLNKSTSENSFPNIIVWCVNWIFNSRNRLYFQIALFTWKFIILNTTLNQNLNKNAINFTK